MSGYFKSIKSHPEKPTVFHLVTMWGGHFAISKEKTLISWEMKLSC